MLAVTVLHLLVMINKAPRVLDPTKPSLLLQA